MKYWALSAGDADDSAIDDYLRATHLRPPVPERRFTCEDEVPAAPPGVTLLVGPTARQGGTRWDDPHLTVVMLAAAGPPEDTELDLERWRHARFLECLAHDLRSPLGLAMSALSQVRRLWPGSDGRPALDLADRGLKRLLREAVNLNLRAEIEGRSRRPPQRQRADLRVVLKSSVEEAVALVSLGRVALEIDLPPDACLVELDVVQMAHAACELVCHGIGHARSRLRVALRLTEASAEFEVAHDGPPPGAWPTERDPVGASLGDAPLPFAFGRYAPGGPVSGGEIGLSLAHEIVVAHGGTLSLLSEPGIEGVRLCLWLPRVPASDRPNATADPVLRLRSVQSSP